MWWSGRSVSGFGQSNGYESVHPLASVTTAEMFRTALWSPGSGRQRTGVGRGASEGDGGRTVCAAVTVDVEPAGREVDRYGQADRRGVR